MRDCRLALPDRPLPLRRERARIDTGWPAIPEPAFIIERALARRRIEQLGRAAALKLWLRRFPSA